MPLSCDSCVKAVSDQLYQLGGITKVEGNLKDQLISVEGSGKSFQWMVPEHDVASSIPFALVPWLTSCPC